MGEGGLTPFKLKRDVLIGLNTLLGWRRDLFIIGGVGGFFFFYIISLALLPIYQRRGLFGAPQTRTFQRMFPLR